MWSKLAIAASGLALSAALGVPAVAQAAVTPSQVAHASAAGPTCSAASAGFIDAGTGKYANDGLLSDGRTTALYFNPLSEGVAELYCVVNYGGNVINLLHQDPAAGISECVSLNSAFTQIGWENACGNTWDKWKITRVGTLNGMPTYQLQSMFSINGSHPCMYDDLQEPAIYTTCSTTNRFEQFVIPPLP